jgi:CheY-like chemotaxis protein
VLINLLSNSFKYTDKGEIEYGFYELENNIIRVYVKDSGIGIKKEEQSYIFNRFSRVDSKNSHLRGGTGLGLAIAYQILKLFGSELHVESEESKGSTFYFDLNYYEGQGEKVDDHQIINLSNKTAVDYDWFDKTILIIEDNKENANFLTAIFKKTNCNIIINNEGEEAIKTLENNKYIDLVILDWLLPDMRGEDIIKFIKKKNLKIPIIVLTAMATIDDKVDILANNIDAYFAKPVEKSALLAKINELLK